MAIRLNSMADVVDFLGLLAGGADVTGPQWVTPVQAAKLTGITPAGVHQQLRRFHDLGVHRAGRKVLINFPMYCTLLKAEQMLKRGGWIPEDDE